jgi:hypothetical protein
MEIGGPKTRVTGAKQEPEWLAEIPVSARRIGVGSLLYSLMPLMWTAIDAYKPRPEWAIYLAPVCALPSVWMVWQWYLRRYRPEVAFEKWDTDERLMKRVYRMKLVMSAAMVLCLAGAVLLMAFTKRIGDAGIVYSLLLANPVIIEYIKDHKSVPKKMPGALQGELKPLQSEHWGEPPVSRA